jgi:hypothetical protein
MDSLYRVLGFGFNGLGLIQCYGHITWPWRFMPVRQLRIHLQLIEQNVQQALRISHQAYVLENGEITLQGIGQELLADPRIIKAYLGT